MTSDERAGGLPGPLPAGAPDRAPAGGPRGGGGQGRGGGGRGQRRSGGGSLAGTAGAARPRGGTRASPTSPDADAAVDLERPKEVADAVAAVEAARDGLGLALDDLTAAARGAMDVRTLVRRHPLRAASLAGGAGFLAVGGPKRVLRAVGRRLRRRRDPYDGLLPEEVRDILRDADAPRQEEVEQALEADFARYLKDRRRVDERPRPNAVTSFWRTYDTLLGPMGAIVTRLAERLATPEPPDEPDRRKDRRAP
jgi:hypothetical protein